MKLTATDIRILIIVRELIKAKNLVDVDAIHYHLNAQGINKATPPNDPMDDWSEFEEMLELTTKQVEALKGQGFIFDTTVFEYGQNWDVIRMTRKGFAQTVGFKVPEATAKLLAPVEIPPLWGTKKKKTQQGASSRRFGSPSPFHVW